MLLFCAGSGVRVSTGSVQEEGGTILSFKALCSLAITVDANSNAVFQSRFGRYCSV